MSPTAEPDCCHCGTPFKSELRWKIPLIIGIFVVAIVLSVVIQILSQ